MAGITQVSDDGDVDPAKLPGLLLDIASVRDLGHGEAGLLRQVAKELAALASTVEATTYLALAAAGDVVQIKRQNSDLQAANSRLVLSNQSYLAIQQQHIAAQTEAMALWQKDNKGAVEAAMLPNDTDLLVWLLDKLYKSP